MSLASFIPRPQWVVDLIAELSGSAGTATWGGITGTLTSQTDLQAALDAKAATADIAELSRDAIGAALVEGAGVDIVVSDAGDTITISASTSGGTLSGTSFPGSPATGDVFRRTDRQIEYYYDGTRWLSSALFSSTFTADVANPKTATFTARLPNPYFGVHDVYIVQFIQSAYVSTTTASNYFVSQLASKLGAASTNLGATLSTQSVTINTHTAQSTNINSVVANTEAVLEVTATETGTCTAFMAHSITYRLVG